MSRDYIAGQRLGDYEVIGVLGAGGMGKVYKVRNTISDRIEAMKILLPNLANQKDLADRFLREIKLLASLDHPNIAALRTALTLDDQLVMIMEYVEGVTVASRLQQGPIPPVDSVNYADQILAALSYAHKLNVIHRDIKPANMMLTPQGIVKLMDFGIARPGNEAAGMTSTGMTATGMTLGSLNYMPPEQVKGETADARSDLYSLGVSLYEMVTGQLPFRGDSGYSLMTAHLQEVPKPPITVRPDLPKSLDEIILIALSKEPAKRFQSADAFRTALKSVFGPLSFAAARPAVQSTPLVQSNPAQASASQPDIALSANEARPSVAAAAGSVAPQAQSNPGGHRGLYMALGALIVVAVLFAAGVYVPRRIKTHASANTTNSEPAPPAMAPARIESEPVNSSVAPSGGQTETTNPPALDTNAAPASGFGNKPGDTDSKNIQPKVSRTNSTPRPVASNASSVRDQDVPAQPPQQEVQEQPNGDTGARSATSSSGELEEAQRQSDQLNSRAAAVSQGLDGLRRQQAAQGYGLRGDIVASEQRMQINLSNAQSALQQQDGKRAQKYLDLAAVEVEKLEKFLGR
jgi:serine/threonine-protein kinase